MATYVDHSYYGWPHEELSRQDNSEQVSASQMLDHGSISFGRFAYDSLSWEKRSVFTYNKCQEELEKFKSPGLVAKKKAYFEEHYKKIRALKALQVQHEQTEITLDYCGDESISSQTGEEDESATQIVKFGEEIADIAIHTEEAPIKVSMVNGNTFEVKIAHSEQGSIIPDSDLSKNNLQEYKPLIVSIQEPIHDHVNNVVVSKENSMSVTNIKLEVDSKERKSSMTNSKERDLEIKPATNIAPRKVMTDVMKCKDDLSIPKLKAPPRPARNGLKLEQKDKSNIKKPSQGPKYPIQKKNVKSTADKVSRNDMSASIGTHKTLKEVRSNVTIPRPFSLATDRRAVVPSGIRETENKLISKSSIQRSSSAVKVKDATDVQRTSNRIFITNSMKSGRKEIKSEEKGKPVTLVTKCTSLKARGSIELGPLKARSVDLPPNNNLCPNSGTDIRFKRAIEDGRRKEETNLGRARESRRADTRVFTPLTVRLRTETKNTTPSLTGNSSISARRQRFGEQSLDGKKRRPEKPRWR